ncbi:hypothetical protein [Neobacillus niacini]|uniref:hypothetical protein n=1 Tax=Neobacillus niacini TaxID=86668 RepID=UPI0028592729|nr:hypothetical protein [Neobacillus niacini]MDR7002683.1 hypothetical protein [Neobacillus niacini]
MNLKSGNKISNKILMVQKAGRTVPMIPPIEDNNNEPALEIPNNAKYEIFHVDITEEQGIVNTWKKIWGRENESTLERAYSYDFEKYYPMG